jgi:hypothetical protein
MPFVVPGPIVEASHIGGWPRNRESHRSLAFPKYEDLTIPPSQFPHLVIQYEKHPEARALLQMEMFATRKRKDCSGVRT